MYQIELVWNREFNFVPYGELLADLAEARSRARALLHMGDGACVKEVRIRNTDTDQIDTERI
jgi:hypothetical protein